MNVGAVSPAVAKLASPEVWPDLAARIRAWLPARRFFASKDRVLAGLAVEDVAVLGAELASVIVACRYEDGGEERYHVPVVCSAGPPPPGAAVIGELDGCRLLDGATVPGAIRALAALALRGERLPTARGNRITGRPTGTRDADAPVDWLPPESAVRPMGVEQSNSSAVLGGELILKVFRRLEAGTNPDVEITAALTHAGFAHVPRQHGAITLEADETSSALVVLSDLVPGAREGWALALADVAGTGTGEVRDHAEALGATVAQLHEALRTAIGSHVGTAADTAAWAGRMQADAARVLGRVPSAATGVVADVVARGDELHGRLGHVAQVTEPGPLVRIHGDLHLGQVLLDTHERWILLDFEGEPARPLAERREPSHPLRDVAGMLRSFDYAAAFGGDAGATVWRDTCGQRFLDGYRFAAGRGAAPLWPPDGGAADALLAAFTLDKALYELGYELANRPHWAAIPAAAILRLLDTTEL